MEYFLLLSEKPKSITMLRMPSPLKLKVLAAFILFVPMGASCASPGPTPAPPTELVAPLPTLSPATETVEPTETPTETASAAPSQTPTPQPQPGLARPQYVLDLRLNFTTKVATVDQTITYPNWTGETLNNLVFAVEPNLWSGGFKLNLITIDDQPVINYVLDGQKLDVSLPQPLRPGGTLSIHINYGLVLPQMQAYSNPEDVRPQIYGYSERQTNLVDWYPFVVPYKPGEGWLLYNPWYYGEHLIYDTADFDLTITFIDGSEPQIAASGEEVDSGISGSRRFVLEAGRTFALSMSLYYKVATETVGDVTVYSYYFAFYDKPGEALLRTTAESMQVYSELFGPYRHKTLTAVQGDFNDGMEFSGFYFISRDYFNLYNNTPKNYLVIIAAHETAHQWWFESVANNQAKEPWLDEALATYSEKLYYEAVHADHVKWWRDYRYFEYRNPGFVDTPIYEGEGQRPYWDKVYLTGAQFLDELRTRVGDEIFFTFLRDYHNRFAGKRATTADFFQVWRANTAADISDLMSKYFSNSY